MKKLLGLVLLMALLMAITANVDATCTNTIGIKVTNWLNKPNVGAWVYLDKTMPTSLHTTDKTGYASFKKVPTGTHKVIVKSGIYTQTQSVNVKCGTSFPVLYFKI